MKKIGFVLVLALILLMNGLMVEGLSVQLKRTNPGIVNIKSAELIFDVVNMDLNREIEGFLLCRSPDDVVISSTLGVGSGSGAQYVSPKFEMNEGPSQKSISLVIESSIEGDMRSGCILKYIPYFTETIQSEVYNNETNETTIIEETIKVYEKMNKETTINPLDRDYRELRLDKTIPFIKSQKGTEISCPENQSSCKANEVEVNVKRDWFMYGFIALAIILVFGVVFMLGRGSKS